MGSDRASCPLSTSFINRRRIATAGSSVSGIADAHRGAAGRAKSYAAEVHHRGLSRWRSGKCASRERPFLYFPLRNHFEQNRHVRQRLARYGAGRYMDYDASPPDVIAGAIAEEIDRPVDYRPVESDGAARAAALIAPLI